MTTKEFSLIHLNRCLFLAPVFCVSLDPLACSYGVSGGEDDKAFVWKVSDGKIKFTCEGIFSAHHHFLGLVCQ